MKKLLGWAVFILIAVVAAASCGADAPGIKIGLNYEMTGRLGWFGQTSVNAIKLYFDQLNLKGGVLGHKVELMLDNNQSKPSEAGKIALKLIQKQKVAALLGPFSSEACLEAARVAQAKGIPMLTPTATNPSVTLLGDCIFRSCFLDKYQGGLIAGYALKNLKLTTAVTVRDIESGYYTDVTAGFKEAFTKGGGNIPHEIIISGNIEDFTPVLNNVDWQHADCIFVALGYRETGLIAKYLREKKIMIPILGGETWNSNGLTRLADQNALHQIYFADHYFVDNSNPLNTAFVDKYQARFGEKPDAVAAMAYDASGLLVQAIENAGSADPSKIKTALAAIRYSGVTGNLTFDADRNPQKTGVIVAWEHGTQVMKEVVEP